MSSAVIEKIEKVLTSEYSIQNYVEFVQEVFDSVNLVAPNKYRKEYTNLIYYCFLSFFQVLLF